MIVALFSSVSLIVKSQKLTIEGTAPGLYITHIVAPKENFYSVSRFYNQPPKMIASFNKIEMEKGLTIGQHVKIPLTAQNFDGGGSSNAGGKRIPLTHIVAKSETLFRIGNNVQVAPEIIRKLNNLSSDNIAAGTPLIVGYLKTNNSQASAAKNNTTPEIGNSGPVKKNANEAVTKQSTAEAKKEAPSAAADTLAKEKTKNTAETEKPDENVHIANEPEKNVAGENTAAEKDTALAVIPENATAPASAEPAKQPETSLNKSDEAKKVNESTANNNAAAANFEGMYASRASGKSENTKSGEAATFKSTSGWQDKKYYVLVNDVAPGTIVKISSGDNKSVYAKVLGSMPEMKENNGLLLRISNAAASSLGIIDPTFHVQISYYQQ